MEAVRIYKTRWRKEWRWQIKARNGRTISASTEGYKNRLDCIDNMHQTYRELRAFFKPE